jgi:hypothetical protein
MASFDNSADPELGAACDRLAAWVEPLPEGQVIDPTSGLTERDLALILRRLYVTRKHVSVPIVSIEETEERRERPSVPVTKKRPWG